jgi:hypothetical protein
MNKKFSKRLVYEYSQFSKIKMDGDSTSVHQLMSLEIKCGTTYDGILYSGH